jgi:hypothetical protein
MTVACTRPVPLAPRLCTIPAFHVQQECKADVGCLLTEFAATLQAEQAVDEALQRCLNIKRGV